jgi:hypothetical protein
MSYRLIDDLQKKAIPVAQSCRVPSVSHAGFYEARHRCAKPVFSQAMVYIQTGYGSVFSPAGEYQAGHELSETTQQDFVD